ncbi:hypothetical protein GCM10020219_037500 [Nonomuraea dietziae]
MRAHYLVTDRPAFPEGNFAIDVTHYPDIAELYLISDVLVTDYSSAMFDYCNTGRPMIFFAYDLANYRDEARGFYFDFEAEAPGPIVGESDQVIEAIAGLRDVEDAFAGKYRSLRGRLLPARRRQGLRESGGPHHLDRNLRIDGARRDLPRQCQVGRESRSGMDILQ